MASKEVFRGMAVVKTQDERIRTYECIPYVLDVGDEVIVESELAPYTLRGSVLATLSVLEGLSVWAFLVALNHGKPFNRVLRKVMYTEYTYPEAEEEEEDAAEEQTEESEVEANG